MATTEARRRSAIRWVYAVLLLVCLPSEWARADPALVARQITDLTPRPTSSRARTRPAVWATGTSNGVVEAIVDDSASRPTCSRRSAPTFPPEQPGVSGGTLIDLGLVGRHNDQINVDLPRCSTPIPRTPCSTPGVVRARQSALAVGARPGRRDGGRGEPDREWLGAPRSQSEAADDRDEVQRADRRAFRADPLDAAQHGNHGAPDLDLRRHDPARARRHAALHAGAGRGFSLPAGGALAFYHTVLGRLSPQNGSPTPTR